MAAPKSNRRTFSPPRSPTSPSTFLDVPSSKPATAIQLCTLRATRQNSTMDQLHRDLDGLKEWKASQKRYQRHPTFPGQYNLPPVRGYGHESQMADALATVDLTMLLVVGMEISLKARTRDRGEQEGSLIWVPRGDRDRLSSGVKAEGSAISRDSYRPLNTEVKVEEELGRGKREPVQRQFA